MTDLQEEPVQSEYREEAEEEEAAAIRESPGRDVDAADAGV